MSSNFRDANSIGSLWWPGSLSPNDEMIGLVGLWINMIDYNNSIFLTANWCFKVFALSYSNLLNQRSSLLDGFEISLNYYGMLPVGTKVTWNFFSLYLTGRNLTTRNPLADNKDCSGALSTSSIDSVVLLAPVKASVLYLFFVLLDEMLKLSIEYWITKTPASCSANKMFPRTSLPAPKVFAGSFVSRPRPSESLWLRRDSCAAPPLPLLPSPRHNYTPPPMTVGWAPSEPRFFNCLLHIHHLLPLLWKIKKRCWFISLFHDWGGRWGEG